MLLKILGSVLILSILIGCKNITSKGYFIYKGEIKIKLTEHARAKSYFPFYYECKDGEYLISINKTNNSIEIYDINKGELTNAIFYNKLNHFESGISSVYVHNFDSIFTISSWATNWVTLMDSSGRIKNQWRPGNFDCEGYPLKVDIFPAKYFNLYYYDNTLVLPLYPKGSNVASFKPPYSEFLNVKKKFQNMVIMKFNGDSLCPYDSIGKSPEVYDSNWYGGYQVTSTFNKDNNCLFSFASDDNLYLYSEQKLLKVIKSKSSYIEKFIVFDISKIRDQEYMSEYVSSTGSYMAILYDKYRNIYYRIVAHPQEYRLKNGQINQSSNRSYSVIILDENFNRLNEVYFPPKKYYFDNILVAKEGLLISNSHDSIPPVNKKYFSFSIFEYTK